MAKIIPFTPKGAQNPESMQPKPDWSNIDFDAFPPPDMSPEEEALHAAQEIIYDAWETITVKKRLALAQKALETSPYCVDAYNIFADHAETYNEALVIYARAADIGEKQLGKDFFQTCRGNFWRILNTRPYMRARVGMVESLYALGDKANVIKQCKDLLKLSSNDNLGMRDILLPLLIETGKDKQAESLYKKYREDYSSAWFYGRALLDYRKYGEGEAANDSLNKALSLNKIAPKYLLMKKKLPKLLPSLYSTGDESDAILLAKYQLAAWHTSEGAIRWLSGRLTQKPKKAAEKS
jgi:hypothetical protein